MRQDKFLLGILIFIGLLVAVSLALFFSRGQPQPVADDTPEGVVYNYLLALQERDYERAYAYLAEAASKPSLWNFRHFYQQNVDFSTLAVEVGASQVDDDSAQVEIIITRLSGDPFIRSWEETGSALLVQQDGAWKIRSLPWQFWQWDWYEEP
ncbi:MAG: hypothetical protein ABWK53_09530 [Anaerolineales bacterium]